MSTQDLASKIAGQLDETYPELAQGLNPRDGGLDVDVDACGPDAVLELEPPAELSEVPVWVPLGSGRAEFDGIAFEPTRVAIVRWDGEHRRCGLLIGFPLMLTGTAVAGEGHTVPVAGGRRADGLLELWLQASPAGEVRADIDADPALGRVAQLRWRTDEGDGRLLVALTAEHRGRRLGQALLPFDAATPVTSLAVLCGEFEQFETPELDREAAARASCTPAGREFWATVGAVAG